VWRKKKEESALVDFAVTAAAGLPGLRALFLEWQ
jgi:hypothetical protein